MFTVRKFTVAISTCDKDLLNTKPLHVKTVLSQNKLLTNDNYKSCTPILIFLKEKIEIFD